MPTNTPQLSNEVNGSTGAVRSDAVISSPGINAPASAPAPQTSQPKEQRFRNKAAGVLLLLLGVAIVASWGAWLADPARNPLVQGLGTIQDGQYTSFVLLAEALMAIAALLGGWGVLQSAWWGTRIAHLGIGLMVYSTLYTLGFSLLREPFLTPIMLGGLAGSVAVFALLWTCDTNVQAAVASKRVERNRSSMTVPDARGATWRTLLVRTGGVVSLLFCILHLLFWQMYDWPRSLNVLPMDGAGIVQVLNVTVAATMVLFGYVSLFHTRVLLTDGLGRALAFGLALFWIVRAVAGVVFFDFSLESLLLFVAMAALYALPQLRMPSASSPQGSSTHAIANV